MTGDTIPNRKNPPIEKAGETDYDEITELWEASVRATHHFLPEEDIAFFKPLLRNEFLQAVNLHLLRKDDGSIQGFIGTVEDRIEMLFVRPGAFGTGIGKRLLHYAITELQAKKVDVNEQNEGAVGFYLHAGFIIKGRSPLDGWGKPYPLLHLELDEQVDS